MSNADMPAMPVSLDVSMRYEEGHYDQPALGLTKREHFAAMAMQGLASKEGYHDWKSLAYDAVVIADALLRQLGD